MFTRTGGVSLVVLFLSYNTKYIGVKTSMKIILYES